MIIWLFFEISHHVAIGSSPQLEFGRYGLKCTFCLMENLDSFLFFQILEFFNHLIIGEVIQGQESNEDMMMNTTLFFLSILFLFQSFFVIDVSFDLLSRFLLQGGKLFRTLY